MSIHELRRAKVQALWMLTKGSRTVSTELNLTTFLKTGQEACRARAARAGALDERGFYYFQFPSLVHACSRANRLACLCRH
jgi:hypothetical protein